MLDLGRLFAEESARVRTLASLLRALIKTGAKEEITIRATRLLCGFYSGVIGLTLKDGVNQAAMVTLWHAPVERVAESVNLAF